VSFGFDPSIILSAKNAPSSDFTDTLQAVAGLKTHQLQQQQVQAQLADLVQKHQQEQTLASIYKANASSPDNLATALMQGGFGSQAYAAQDQASQTRSQEATHQKLISDVQEAHRKHVGELFYGTTGPEDYLARRKELASNPDPMLAIYASVLPEKWDKGITERLGNLAVPAVERAKLAARPTGSGQVIVGDDGTQYVTNKSTGAASTVRDEDGNAIKARPLKGRGGGGGGGGTGGAGTGLSSQALEDAVDAYHTSGALPTFPGKMGAVLKLQILNRSSEKYAGTNAAVSKADYKANAKSLEGLQKTADFVDSYEKTGEKNLETFLESAKKVRDFGSPLFNASAREFATKVSGDPNMAAFEASRQTAVQEIGKLLSGATGSGALSEGQRHEVENLLPKDASWSQIQAAATVLRKDMANRKAAVQEQLKEINGRISGKSAAAEKGASSGLSADEADELKRLEAKYGGKK
jgi:hypothetical protein